MFVSCTIRSNARCKISQFVCFCWRFIKARSIGSVVETIGCCWCGDGKNASAAEVGSTAAAVLGSGGGTAAKKSGAKVDEGALANHCAIIVCLGVYGSRASKRLLARYGVTYGAVSLLCVVRQRRKSCVGVWDGIFIDATVGVMRHSYGIRATLRPFLTSLVQILWTD